MHISQEAKIAATLAHRPKGLIILSWVLRIVLALLFLGAALAKLFGQPMMITEFGQVGLGQGFRYVTALLELCGAATLVVPATALYGAAILLLVDAGALVAQLTRIHMDWLHTIVIGALLVAVIVIQRRTR